MSTVLAFVGMFLLSLFVALLAALQLADYFSANEEFIIVLMALPIFVLFAMAVFAIAYAASRRSGAFTVVAAVLALLSLVQIALPKLVLFMADRSTNPFVIGREDAAIILELMIPALLAILVQWALVRRRWLRMRGEDDFTRWPWVTTMVTGLAVLNPVGLDVVGQALAYQPSNWLRDLVVTVALTGAGVLIAMGLIEYYIRGRMLHRRTLPAAGIGAAG